MERVPVYIKYGTGYIYKGYLICIVYSRVYIYMERVPVYIKYGPGYI